MMDLRVGTRVRFSEFYRPPAHATIVISSDRGGLVSDYAARFLSARDSGEQVVIDGACLSACTLVVGLVKRDKVCATPNAVLGFHSAWRPMGRGKRVNSPVASEAMLNVYPAELRKWIVHRGGLGSKMIFLHGHELAEIVPSCGSSMLAGLTKSRNYHRPHVVKSDTPPAAHVARQGR
jgi:hypothetical protein